MNCTSYTLSGLNAGCKDSVGGVAKVWLADATNIKWTISNDGTAAPTGGISEDWKVYNLRKGAASMTSTFTDNENAGSYFATEVTMNFLKMENAKRLEVMAMLMGQCTGVVKDRNGKYWAIGVENPLEGSAGEGSTGTAAADANQYTVTISADDAELPREITDATVIADLEAITVV